MSKKGITHSYQNRIDHSPANRLLVLVAFLHASGGLDTLVGILGDYQAFKLFLWLLLYAWAAGMLWLYAGTAWLAWLFRNEALLMPVLLIATISVVWSENPSLTLQRDIHLIGTTIVAVFIGLHFSIATITKLLGIALFILLFGSLSLALLAPGYGLQVYQGELVWAGLFGSKNDLGLTASIGVLFYISRGFSSDAVSRIAYAVMACLSFVALIMSQSVTSFIALMVGLFIGFSLFVERLLRFRGLFVWFVSVILCICALIILTYDLLQFDLMTNMLERSSTLSSRTLMWEATWPLIRENPWLGVGYGTLWLAKPGSESTQLQLLDLGWYASHAHNGFLQIASELGIPAGIAAVMFQLQAAVRATRRYIICPEAFVLFVVSCQFVILTSSLVEARLFVSRNLFWLLFLVLVIALQRSKHNPIPFFSVSSGSAKQECSTPS